MEIHARIRDLEGEVGRLSRVQKILLGTDGSVTSYPGINPGYALLPSGVADNDSYLGEIWVYVDTAIAISIWEE